MYYAHQKYVNLGGVHKIDGYGFNHERYDEVLILSSSEYDLIWKQYLCDISKLR